jgi:hypothetical protein
MKDFLKSQFQIIVQSVLIALILFFIHNTLLNKLFPKAILIVPLYQIYLFHFVVTSTIIFIVIYKKHQGNENVFNLFVLFTLLKMLLVVIFLLPVFLSDVKNKNYDVFNFFMPYFIYLTFEVYSITKLLQKQN